MLSGSRQRECQRSMLADWSHHIGFDCNPPTILVAIARSTLTRRQMQCCPLPGACNTQLCGGLSALSISRSHPVHERRLHVLQCQDPCWQGEVQTSLQRASNQEFGHRKCCPISYHTLSPYKAPTPGSKVTQSQICSHRQHFSARSVKEAHRYNRQQL